MNSENKSFLIGGEFTIDFSKNKDLINQYKNEILSESVLQIVKNATHFSSYSKPSLLDHVYTNLSKVKTQNTDEMYFV